MYNGHPVIDMDCHIREYWDPDRVFKEHMDPEYRDQYERFSKKVKAHKQQAGDIGWDKFLWPQIPVHPMGVYDDLEIDGPRRPDSRSSRQLSNLGVTIDPACNWDPAVRLRDMDRAMIDINVIFASQSAGFCALDDIGFESALYRAQNRFTNTYCAAGAGRLWWAANANLRDVPETIAQLKAWRKQDPNFAGMLIPRACPDGAMLDHPRLHPLFALSQELDLPIFVHGGSTRPPATPWTGLGAGNALHHGMGGMYAVAGLIGGGVFDLFPKLRIGIFESRADWMPWLIEVLDDGYIPGSRNTPLMRRRASEVVAGGQLYCAVESDETLLDLCVQNLGEDSGCFRPTIPTTERPGQMGCST